MKNRNGHIEFTDAEIVKIRESLRNSNDKFLIPLGHDLSDYQIERIATLIADVE